MFSFFNINSIEKNKENLRIFNNRERSEINCIYGLDNKQFEDYIKIGSTNNPQQRKWDYQTSSPYKFSYLWIFYLEDFNCYLVDDLLKYELKNFNVKEDTNGGIEFYRFIDYTHVEEILNKYDIKYELEIGDKYLEKKKIDSESKNNLKNHLSLSSRESKMNEVQMAELFSKFTLEEQINMLQSRGVEIPVTINPEYDISNYKYQFIKKRLDNLNRIILEDIDCQSINFFYEKLIENVKNIIILGLIQSGKTKEIIGLLHFVIVYLKIPIIILIQNKTSAYKQMEDRIRDFSNKLNSFNIKTRYCKGIRENAIMKGFNYDNPVPEVIICLSNFKQLQRLEGNLKKIEQHRNNRIVPYILVMDEYDDHVKSRLDEEDENNLKIVERSTKFLKDRSYINVGVTATLLACMITDEKTKVCDIFQLKPSQNYVGFGCDRIKIIDIKKKIDEINNKRLIHISKLNDIMQNIDNSVNYEDKSYSITLINTTDDTKEHNEIFEELSNEFEDWGVILFNSRNDNSKNSEIECKLPNIEFSKIPIVQGNINEGVSKLKTITEHKNKIPQNHPLYREMMERDTYLVEDDKYKYLYKYSITFLNYSISDIISELMKYTDKVAVISGRMACRGISFVTNDYQKHITDMVYVPSGSSHLTRNVQDMRIFGNFPNDGIDINLYIDKENYFSNVGGYINLQNNLLNGNIENLVEDEEEHNFRNTNLRQSVMDYDFNPEEVPEKKLDRIGLVKGINFKQEDKWGVPTYIDNYETCESYLQKRFPDYEILSYSKAIDLDLSNVNYKNIQGKFIYPTKENNVSTEYKFLFNNNFKDDIEKIGNSFNNLNNYKFKNNTQWFVYDNYRNGWPLYNPLKNRRDLIDLCYMGNDGELTMKIILKNPLFNKLFLENTFGKKKIIIFYSRGCYHYTKCDKDSYFVQDKKKNIRKIIKKSKGN